MTRLDDSAVSSVVSVKVGPYQVGRLHTNVESLLQPPTTTATPLPVTASKSPATDASESVSVVPVSDSALPLLKASESVLRPLGDNVDTHLHLAWTQQQPHSTTAQPATPTDAARTETRSTPEAQYLSFSTQLRMPQRPAQYRSRHARTSAVAVSALSDPSLMMSSEAVRIPDIKRTLTRAGITCSVVGNAVVTQSGVVVYRPMLAPPSAQTQSLIPSSDNNAGTSAAATVDIVADLESNLSSSRSRNGFTDKSNAVDFVIEGVGADDYFRVRDVIYSLFEFV
jgi:hypothetical protein